MTLSPAQFDSAFAAFERAIAAAGSQSELARIVGCTPANIGQHLKARRLLPPRFVIAAEFGTGVSRYDLRPDIYPPEERADHLPAAPHSFVPSSDAQQTAAHPSAPASLPPRPEAGVDGPTSVPAAAPAPAQAGDPLKGLAA